MQGSLSRSLVSRPQKALYWLFLAKKYYCCLKKKNNEEPKYTLARTSYFLILERTWGEEVVKMLVALHVETWSGPAAVHRECPELAPSCGGGRAVEVGVESFE